MDAPACAYISITEPVDMRTLAELTLPIDTETDTHALEWLDAACRQAGWPERTQFKLRLCLDETVTNVLLYGYSDPPSDGAEPCLRLCLAQEGDEVFLIVMDNGVPFDPTARQPRELDASLDDARIGGHGLRLMRHYLRDIRYERADGWNRLTLVAGIDEAS